MESKLLTVVIPTYNIDKYIGTCINSFKNVSSQFYKDFELIVVNDGSTDNSLQLVESLAKDSDLDVIIINKENGGHGSTINTGIREAKGKYLKVVDGDDWIDVHNFETFLSKLKEIDVDMVITNYTEQHIYNETTKTIDFSGKYQGNVIIESIPNERIPMHALTYRTNILKSNNINISEKTFYVDMEYTLLPLKYVSNYIYLNLNIYQYFLGRPDQSMNVNVMKEKSDHHLRVLMKILELYNEIRGDKKLEYIVKNTLKYLINTQVLLLLSKNNKKDIDSIFEICEKQNYRWEIDIDKKITTLMYLNYKSNNLFNFIVNPIVNRKQKELGESYVN